MNSSADELLAAFSALPDEQKVQVLLSLIHDLTIEARGAFLPHGPQSQAERRLWQHNEAIHRVSSLARDTLDGSAHPAQNSCLRGLLQPEREGFEHRAERFAQLLSRSARRDSR